MKFLMFAGAMCATLLMYDADKATGGGSTKPGAATPPPPPDEPPTPDEQPPEQEAEQKPPTTVTQDELKQSDQPKAPEAPLRVPPSKVEE